MAKKNDKELEQENKLLKRQLAKLQKLLQKELDQEQLDPEPTNTETEEPVCCEICGSKNIASYITPFSKRKVFGCKNCKKWRHSIPPK